MSIPAYTTRRGCSTTCGI